MKFSERGESEGFVENYSEIICEGSKSLNEKTRSTLISDVSNPIPNVSNRSQSMSSVSPPNTQSKSPPLDSTAPSCALVSPLSSLTTPQSNTLPHANSLMPPAPHANFPSTIQPVGSAPASQSTIPYFSVVPNVTHTPCFPSVSNSHTSPTGSKWASVFAPSPVIKLILEDKDVVGAPSNDSRPTREKRQPTWMKDFVPS